MTMLIVRQVEYLWPPCTFLEPDGTPTVEAVGGDGGGGVVTVVPVTLLGPLSAATGSSPSARRE